MLRFALRRPSHSAARHRRTPSIELRNIFDRKCHEVSLRVVVLCALVLLPGVAIRAQNFEPPLPSPPPASAETPAPVNVSAADPNSPAHIARPADAPKPGWVDVRATT